MTAKDILKLLDTGGVVRYHTGLATLLKTQDLAQHVYGVLWFCWALSYGRPSAALLLAALSHDAGERKTGDMPGNTKRLIGARAALDKMEAEFLSGLGFPAPELNGIERAVLHLADALDGCAFCWREARLGNRTEQLVAVYRNFVRYTEEAFSEGVYGNGDEVDTALAYDLLQLFKRSYNEISE